MKQTRTLTRLRPARLILAAVALALLPAAQVSTAEAAATCTHAGSVVTCTYGYTGAAETWTVPPGVTQVAFQVVGAPGGRSGGSAFAHADGGRGADLKATLTLNPGTPVIITVGGPGGTDGQETGGFNGGGGGQYQGNSYGLAGGGGGASDVRIGGAALADRVLVAGGGGGGGGYGRGSGSGGSGGQAGGAGGDAGAAGAAGSPSPDTGVATPGGGGGGAGTTNAGGAGGTAGQGRGGATGAAGALGQGGAVADNLSGGPGGGGGGGVYGGGGGGAAGADAIAATNPGGGGGGGGASGYTSGLGIAGVSLSVDTARVPKVVITYTDTTGPSVTVNQATGQADPTGSNPVLFTATFNEPVSGFGAAGVTLGGTANLSGAAVTVTGGPSVYSISVAGLAGVGTVTAAVAANAATDAAGNGNTASTSTDNTVNVTFATAPQITLDPTDQTVLNGEIATFTAAASGTPAPTVQWQFSTDGGATWFNLAGATSTTLLFTANGGDGTQFRAVFTNAASSATSAAGTLTVITDTTPPVITPNVVGTLGNNGWYVSNVSLTWTVSDPESAITSQTGCEAQNITADTTGVTFTCSATSAGGTSTSQPVTIKRDATKPLVASATPDRAPNAASWYNAPLAVAFDGLDATSGIAYCTSTTYSGPDNAAASVYGTCTDNAGNVSIPVGFGFQYDATAPTVTGATPDRAPNPAGWYNAPVTVSFSGSDATSGIASCTKPTYSSPDSATASVAGTCTDNAGNTSSPAGYGLQYDATAPVLAPTIAPNPPSLNLAATASPNASDATSGVASSSCAQPDTTSAGAKSLACTATDNAGNTATALLNYTVVNNAPTIAVARGGSCSDDKASGKVKLTVGDVNTGAGGLTLRVVTNSNPQLVPNNNVVFGGSGANRTMSVTAASKKSGTATVTVGVSDGVNTTNLVVTVIVGTAGNELINGTGGTDLIFGLLGRNTINGLGGNDLLCGGNGVDTINGGEGDDTLYGNRGDDVLTGGLGADYFSGGQGSDTVTDFSSGQGDTKDNTVEKVTRVGASAADAPVAGDPTFTTRVFLPSVQH